MWVKLAAHTPSTREIKLMHTFTSNGIGQYVGKACCAYLHQHATKPMRALTNYRIGNTLVKPAAHIRTNKRKTKLSP
jgi:hypothetical protein